MESVLRIDRISKVFRIGFIPKKVVALDQISLEVNRGKIFGLLGQMVPAKLQPLNAFLV